jgi:2-dehydro-3-deoxygluconokinase
MQVNDLNGSWQECIASSQWLHVSGISLALSANACETVLAAMRWARRNGTRVCLDSNLRLNLWTPSQAQRAMAQALPLCDLFLPSLEDMAHLTGQTLAEDIVQWSHHQGVPHVVVKLGAHGALCSQAGQRTRLSAHPVQLVDATGAGDCFAGNLLARLATGEALTDAARYANAAAGLSVQGRGAVAPLPRAAAVMQMLGST